MQQAYQQITTQNRCNALQLTEKLCVHQTLQNSTNEQCTNPFLFLYATQTTLLLYKHHLTCTWQKSFEKKHVFIIQQQNCILLFLNETLLLESATPSLQPPDFFLCVKTSKFFLLLLHAT